MSNIFKTAIATTIIAASSASLALSIADQVAQEKATKLAAQLEIYKNYVPNPEDGEMAHLDERIYLKMTAPHYFKEGDSLEWKNPSASYWK